MIQSFAAVIEITTQLDKMGADAVDDEALHAVAVLFQNRASSEIPNPPVEIVGLNQYSPYVACQH